MDQPVVVGWRSPPIRPTDQVDRSDRPKIKNYIQLPITI